MVVICKLHVLNFHKIIIVLSFLKIFGMDVYEIENLEETDKKIQELVDKKYNTIFISNEVASFSQDIIKKYNRFQNINIIIIPSKKNKM